MFDRFVRLAQAKKALQRGHFEEALGLVDDPLVREHRRAEGIRRDALRGLMERAGRRADAGSVSAAIGDIDLVLGRAPEFDGAKSLRSVLDQEREERDSKRHAGHDLCRRARAHIERGELAEAATMLNAAAGDAGGPSAEIDTVRSLLEARRQAASRNVVEAREATRRDDLEAAREALDSARALDRDVEGATAVARDLTRAVSGQLVDRLEQLRRRGSPAEVLREFGRQRAVMPDLGADPRLRKIVASAVREARRGVVDAFETGDLDKVVEGLQKIDAGEREIVLEALGTSSDEIREVADQRRRGDFTTAAATLRRLADVIGAAGLRKAAKSFEQRAVDADAALVRARDLAADGDLVAAREVLLDVLETSPMHEVARREMDLIDEGARDKERRLAAARALSKAGKLREASAMVLALAVAGPQGEEARLLLRDLQSRIDVVQSGIRQVQRDAHRWRRYAPPRRHRPHPRPLPRRPRPRRPDSPTPPSSSPASRPSASR